MSVDLETKITSVKADSQCEALMQLQQRLEIALDENIRLKSVIHDVSECNKRWQKYNGERQGYVQRLLTTIKELQQPEAETVPLAEAEVLRQQLIESERRYRRLADDYDKSRQQYSDHIQLLGIQVKMYQDDWEAEKRDKNGAMHTIKKLQEAVMRLNGKVFDLNQRSNEQKNTVYVCTCRIFSNDAANCSVAKLRRRKFPNSRDIEILPCQLLPKNSSNGLNFQLTRSNQEISDESLQNSVFCKEESADVFAGTSPAPSSDEYSHSPSPPLISSSQNIGRGGKSNSSSATLTDAHVRLPGTAASPSGELVTPPSGTCHQQKTSKFFSGADAHSDWLVCLTCHTRFSNNLVTQFNSHVIGCMSGKNFRISE